MRDWGMRDWGMTTRRRAAVRMGAVLLGAAALVQPVSLALRRAGAIGLAAYAVCVFPANIHHFALDMARADGGFGLGYHIPRMIAQPILVWLALWTGGVTDWPLHRR